MILTRSPDEAKETLIRKVLSEGELCKSRFGNYYSAKPSLVVVEKPEYFGYEFDYDVCGESYSERFLRCVEAAVEKLIKSPHSRRVSIPIWYPKDHNCRNPAAITEISFLVVEKLHLTAFVRSLDSLNYFEHNFDFLIGALEDVSRKTGIEAGSVALLVGIPHIYERDIERAKSFDGNYEEVYGYNRLATHLVEDYISSAWHSALEVIYNNGNRKRTEWGDIFEGQGESLSVHRLFIEIRKPEENKIHDKAPFTEKYGVDYAHNYIMHAAKLDEEVRENILKEGEEYTYAERARYCERDYVKVDQLHSVINKLRDDKCRRDCYVGISRPWDLYSDDPPCLRGYQFSKYGEKLVGTFYMRSNDAYGAMHANMFAFALLTRYIAELTGFDSYAYNHFALDAHIYNEFLEAVRDILYPESPSYSDFI
ncbi:thymidylate synthase [Archaeoglobus neptunius]|uniref:thymidylate synthase n=1 Tax=Archaeoglobus neptunius TaxID=2798580 RepID=UPI00192783FA|nr:thymidylate synthase [Archaeoglobus neptunius]